jgi:hypothetical protein
VATAITRDRNCNNPIRFHRILDGPRDKLLPVAAHLEVASTTYW